MRIVRFSLRHGIRFISTGMPIAIGRRFALAPGSPFESARFGLRSVALGIEGLPLVIQLLGLGVVGVS
jgi:hypothetical protein